MEICRSAVCGGRVCTDRQPLGKRDQGMMQRGKMAKGQAGRRRRRQGVTTSLNLSFTHGRVFNRWGGGGEDRVFP